MQDIGPDMEDLFRRASEDYPLKQGEDKWSEIASKINDEPMLQPANSKQTRYRKYYAMLLLLLMFLALDFFFFSPVPRQNANLKKLQTNKLNQVVFDTKKDKPIAYKNSDKAYSTDILILSKNNFNGVRPEPVNKKNEQQFVSTMAPTESEHIKNFQSVNEPIISKNNAEMIKVFDINAPTAIKMQSINSIQAGNSSISNINSADTGSNSEQPISSISKTAEKKVTNKTSMHSFYYGLLLGTELNSIEKQDMEKVGFEIGIIGGYHFSRHLSAETGVLYSQKSYTTAGKYFSLKEIGSMMPAGMKIVDVRGTSKVVEIPVHLRYNAFIKKDHRFFSSAGFSSYILTKESNRYHTSLNGTEYTMYATYKNKRGYFATSLDLAVGYEKNFGKKSSIRFQPYIQLPLKGIGVGNLKVMSTGFQIAITR